MAENVRVRFAPSPTGEPHIGNIRTALFNWLFARRHGGDFVVRVEDTDQERLVPGALDAVLESLDWLKIDWDEGPRVEGPHAPYVQSQRLDNYKELANTLVERGHAYPCYCTRERLDQMRKEQQARKQGSGYDRRCRHLTQEQRSDLEAEGAPYVIRFATPTSGITEVEDLIRGHVEWRNELLDDFVILKSDGFPTYHLGVVTDDHLMEISHVLRAEEWLPSTPRHIQLYQALNFDPPQFGHLPIIMGPDRAKLSKRHGATALLDYREEGYLPEAMLNFMVLLGWALDDKTEVMPTDDIIKGFSLEHITKSSAIFDREKLTWMNGVYIRELPAEELAGRMLPFLERDLPSGLLPVDPDYLAAIAPLVQERIKLLSDSAEMTRYFFEDLPEYDAKTLVQRGMDAVVTRDALEAALEKLRDSSNFENLYLEEMLRAAGQELGLSPRQFFGALRTAVTGRTATPPLFETMEVLGRDRVLRRLECAVDMMASLV